MNALFPAALAVGLLASCGGAPATPVAPSPALATFLASISPDREQVDVRVRALAADGTPAIGLLVVARDPPATASWRPVGRTGPDGVVTVQVLRGSTLSTWPPGVREPATAALHPPDVRLTSWDVPTNDVLPDEVVLYVAGDLCDVDVRFRRTDGALLQGSVDVSIGFGGGDGPSLTHLDAASGGLVRLPCGERVPLVARGPAGRAITVVVEPFRITDPWVFVDATRRWAEIALSPARRLDVHVHDDTGRPIVGAAVRLGDILDVGQTLTDDAGDAVLWDAPSPPLGQLEGLSIDAEGMQPLRTDLQHLAFPWWLQLVLDRSVLVGETDEGWAIDVTLARTRWVEVHCGGLPIDACGGALGCEAATGGRETRGRCDPTLGDDVTVCACPPGEAVIDGLELGRTRVPADARSVVVQPPPGRGVWIAPPTDGP